MSRVLLICMFLLSSALFAQAGFNSGEYKFENLKVVNDDNFQELVYDSEKFVIVLFGKSFQLNIRNEQAPVAVFFKDGFEVEERIRPRLVRTENPAESPDLQGGYFPSPAMGINYDPARIMVTQIIDIAAKVNQ